MARTDRLEVSQQPKSSPIRDSGLNVATLNPLPVAKLRIESNRPPAASKRTATSKKAPAPQPELCLQNPNLFCVATLCYADTHEEVDVTGGRLKGNRVSSILQLKESYSSTGEFSGFFCFRKLSSFLFWIL